MFLPIIITFIYLLFFLWLLSGFDNLYNKETKISELKNTFISVIISVKNEELNLDLLINALINQNFPYDAFEIIIVNDGSKDSTLEILKSYEKKVKNLKVININNTPKDWTNKKWALQNAINNSKGDIILQTDGDCVPQKNWILSMVAPFDNPEVGFVTGFTPLDKGSDSFIDKLLFLESMAQDSFTAACMGKQLTVSCVGRSISFRKKYFDKIEGYANIKNIESGDDDLLLHHIIHSNSCRSKYISLKDSYVYSRSPKTIKEFINQRLRFASKGILYYNLFFISKELKLILPFLYIANLMVIISLIFFINNPIGMYIIPYIFKTSADFLLVYIFNNILFTKWDTISFIILSIFHPFYIILFSSIAPFKKIYWK